jgi:hypothetical protein
MKKILILSILVFLIGCANKEEGFHTDKNKYQERIKVTFKSEFSLQNPNLLSFMDSFVERCKNLEMIDSSDVDNNFYLLYIYQNDFFTRIKISFISPYKEYLKYVSKGTGYFEYKGRVFILITGLDRLCSQDSALQKELQLKYQDRILNFDKQIEKSKYKNSYLQTITWEADIIGDTIFVKKGTRNPCDPPPSDTAELYKYMRSIKSFTY